jgi:hypothetical protein
LKKTKANQAFIKDGGMMLNLINEFGIQRKSGGSTVIRAIAHYSVVDCVVWLRQFDLVNTEG